MATVAYPTPQSDPKVGSVTISKPKHSNEGLWSWLTTIDHKRIGIMYGVSAFLFFLLGGLEAIMIRVQLARPENTFMDVQRYNEMFTMHGTTMVFLALMPLSAAFFNYIIPLQIGARDVAFPRLNSFSFWTWVAGAIVLNLPLLVNLPSTFAYALHQAFGVIPVIGQPMANLVPDQGWYGYAPLTSTMFSGNEINVWALGLQILGLASLAASFNFIITIINMRAPGMSMMRLPIFTWTTLIVQILIAMSFPAVTIGLLLLTFDHLGGTHFYSPYTMINGQVATTGGDPLLWQHLFWIFGHPEVYILVLPAFGIVSEIIPVFSRKPLFGYGVMVYATAAIAFLGFGVWAHHMFVTGLGPVPNAVFAAGTMLIAIPTGVKILNWTATMWGGSLRFPAAMLFSIGLVSQFVIGGLSGVMHAVVPVDTQQNDSYFVVAHFHYVLFGGTVFGLFAGIYYWWPKIFGKQLDEGLGKLHFWMTFIGFNLTFFPMHFLGLAGMPRRYWSYGHESGWWFWNSIVTLGSLLIAASVLVFLINVTRTAKYGAKAGNDPWDGATIEWAIPSPPPVYNFKEIPTVTHRDQLWYDKYGDGHSSSETAAALATRPHWEQVDAAEGEDADVHMPNPSFYPLLLAVGILIGAFGVLTIGQAFNPQIQIAFLGLPVICAAALALIVIAVYGWSFEPASDPAH